MHFLFLGTGDLSFPLQAWNGIMILLCKLIYKLIAGLFQLFVTVSRLNILSSDEIAPIYQRVTMILTIIMVFYITFEFVKYVIQPDTFSDKEKGAGKLVYRIIISILLIAFIPKIFTLGYEFQNKVIENQVLSKIILGKKNMDFKTYGYDFSANLFSLFYSVDREVCGGKCSEAEALVNSNLEKLRVSGETKYLDEGINAANKVKIDGESTNRAIINFDGLFAVIVGGFVVYILILYSIDVGTRYAQLIFLQILSPIAALSYISPKKDGMFSKWTKQSITTYIDLFIRLAIIYFVLLIIQILGTAYDNGNLFQGLGEISPFMKTLCYIVLIMGLLIFANKAPKMLSELIPSSGAAGIGFGLRSPSQVLKDAPLLGRTIGAGYAATRSSLRNMRKSTGKMIENLRQKKWGEAARWLYRGTAGSVGAALGGAWNGAQATDLGGWQRAMKKTHDRRQAKYKIRDTGYGPIGKSSGKFFGDIGRNIFMMDLGVEDLAAGQDLTIQALQNKITSLQTRQDGVKDYSSRVTVLKSKVSDKYMLYDNKDGRLLAELKRNKGETDIDFRKRLAETARDNDENLGLADTDIGIDNITVADLTSQLGKAEGKSKAFHQKENEAKDKK